MFAEFGYDGALMDEIARRSDVSAPILYDHFPSKRALHRRLLERHFAELRALWAQQLAVELPPDQQTAQSLDAWFAYVQAHPYASRMLFRETTGDAGAEAIHREVAAASKAAMLPLIRQQLGDDARTTPAAAEMVWEMFRAALQALALWWYEHQDVPREDVVATAMNTLWIGAQRLRQGERWQPS